MLILTRRKGETLRIGDDIVISVEDVRGDTVRIGISAPRTVRVLREEVFQRITAENTEAASSTATDADLAALLPPA